VSLHTKLLLVAFLSINAVALADSTSSTNTIVTDDASTQHPTKPALDTVSNQEHNKSFTDDEIETALKTLDNDPNLATERKIKSLHWVGKKTKRDTDKPSEAPGWLQSLMTWLSQFFSWVVETGRILVWTVGFILAAVLVVWVLRYLRARQPGSLKLAAVLPTHVRDLDIRPESLPDDIGNAAHIRWQSGAHRDALSLLYRGCLSRLVHTHGIAIKHSSTEGECSALAAAKMGSRYGYVAHLIRTWQQAVYGGSEPSDETFGELCAGFNTALDAVSPSSSRDLIGAHA
jgi:Domain of unknown function (DUF4129)